MKTYSVKLRMPDGEVRIQVGADEHILDAADRAGLHLPSTCRQGWCITCAGRILEGEVDQSDALRFFSEDRTSGFVLLCTAKPSSHLVIQTHQKRTMQEHRRQNHLPAPLG